MAGFSTIAIIYNPNATGHGRQLAERLIRKLQTRLPDQKFELLATERTRHAETLAYNLAKASANPLIISASGDGGYHEVINGILRAQAEGAKPAAGLLPAGNANDHYRNVHRTNIVEAICAAKERRIDILKLITQVNGQTYERHAHSYIGFGLTAKIGHNLVAIKGKKLQEVLAVAYTAFSARPTELVLNGTVTKVHSLIMSNVKTMAKYFKVSQNSLSDDGKFEISLFSSRSRLRLAAALIKRMTIGLRSTKQATKYDFRTVDATLVQLDGEVITIDAHTLVTIKLEPQALRCIV